jgi:glutathione S-transferase
MPAAPTMEALALYDFQGSPCARRVRIVLLEKGLDWTTRIVDLTRMEASDRRRSLPERHEMARALR